MHALPRPVHLVDDGGAADRSPCAGSCGTAPEGSGCPVRGLRRVETIARLSGDGRLPVRGAVGFERTERSA